MRAERGTYQTAPVGRSEGCPDIGEISRDVEAGGVVAVGEGVPALEGGVGEEDGREPGP